jgi:hypothetical protein
MRITFVFLLILVFTLLFVNGCTGACRDDSDCVLDDCCNPNKCIKKSGADPCSSIFVCEEPVPEVSCRCVEGECVMVNEEE